GLIGRSLRAVVDLEKLGERTFWIDCDVLEADGGTRTAAINGAFVAICDALASVPAPSGHKTECIRDSVAAVSVGLLAETEYLDLNYAEDQEADVDLTLVMTGGGHLMQVEAGGEGRTIWRFEL